MRKHMYDQDFFLVGDSSMVPSDGYPAEGLPNTFVSGYFDFTIQ